MKFKDITIISDMDGTLLTEDKHISEENSNAINYFRENGGSFVIASGRIYKKIEMFSHLIHMDLPVISHNGAIIYDFSKKEILYSQFLTGNYVEVIEEIYHDYPFIGVEVYTKDDAKFIKHNPYIEKHIEDEGFADKKAIRWYGFRELEEKWCKILMANSPKDNDMLEKILPKKYPQFQFVRSEAHYYEILPHDTTKGSAAIALMKMLNKPMDKLYAIGDNMNDCELLKTAKTGIAVKNAADELKKHADIVLPYTNEEHAIAKVITMLDQKII